MSRTDSLIFSALLLACWASISTAADSPAKLVVDEDSIEALLHLPSDLEPGRYTVYCEAPITQSSNALRVHCYKLNAPATGSLTRAVSLAASKARYVPALRDGKRIDVYMVFMVLVDTTLDEALILAVPNNGAERERFGLLYSAPQPILARRQVMPPPLEYEEVFSNRRLDAGPSKLIRGAPDTTIWARTQVDEHGKVVDVALDTTAEISPEKMRRFEQRMRERQFLPGFHDRKPTAMFYAEPFVFYR